MNDTQDFAPQSDGQATDFAQTVDVEKVRADAAAKATEDTRIRLKAITTASEAKKVPSLAAHFAFDTELSAEVAIAAMKAAVIDLGPENTGFESGKAESFEHRKVAEGTLGLAQDEEPSICAGWGTLQ